MDASNHRPDVLQSKSTKLEGEELENRCPSLFARPDITELASS